MPSVWEVAGEAIGGTILAPLVIGGVIVTAIASPEARQRMRRLGVRGMAAALAARDAARRELRVGANGRDGLAAQIGHRLKEAAAEVREDWDDFVAEARAERVRRAGAAGRHARTTNGAAAGNGETAPAAAAPAHSARRTAKTGTRRAHR